MADETSEDVTGGLGSRLLQRASAPGVIRPDLGALLQRRSFAGGAGLGAEIQRRWSPGAPVAWGYGSELPYFGAGGWRAAAGAGPGGGGEPMQARPARALPVARPVGAAMAGPAAPSLSGLGESLQRRHRGGRGRESGVVQRRAIGGGLSRPLEEGTPGRLGLAGTRIQPEGRSFLPPGADVGPAIARRGAGLPAAGRPGSPGLPVQRAAMPPTQAPAGPDRSRAAAAPVRSGQPVVERGPAVIHHAIHHAAGPGSVQRRSLASAGAGQIPIQRASAEGRATSGAGLPGPLVPQARPRPETLTAVAPLESTPVEPAPSALEPRTTASHRRTARPEASPAAGNGAVLPFVQRLAADGGGAGVSAVAAGGPAVVHRAAAGNGGGSIRLRRTAGAPIQRATAPSPAPAAELTLARSVQPAGRQAAGTNGLVVQRCGSEIPMEGNGTAPPPPKKTEDHPQPAAAGLDLEDVVERVMRRLTRSLAVERERHGGYRWP